MNRKFFAAIVALALAALLIGSAVAGPKKAWLGVYTQEVDRDLADAFGLSVKYGAIVNSVVKDSPADKAGILEDDIIIEINGSRITDDDDLQYTIQRFDPDEEVTVTVMRDNDRVELKATLGRYSSRDKSRRWSYGGRNSGWSHAPYTITLGDDSYSFIGVELTDVSRGVAKSLGAERNGVLINEVEKDSPAEEAGLLPGDLIVQVDGEEVAGSDEVAEIIRSFDEGDKVAIEVVRDRSKVDFEVEVGAAEYGFGSHRILHIPDLPAIDFSMPRMRGLHWGDYDDDLFDSKEFQDEMDELRKELEKMRIELQELRDSKD